MGKLTFDDDDVASTQLQSMPAATRIWGSTGKVTMGSDSDTGSDSDAPVEEATTSTAPGLSRAATAVQAQKDRRLRAQRARAEAKKTRRSQNASAQSGASPEESDEQDSEDSDMDQSQHNNSEEDQGLKESEVESEDADLDETENESEDESEMGSGNNSEEDGPSTRLDPELFKKAFARQAALYEQEADGSSRVPTAKSSARAGEKRKASHDVTAEDKMLQLKELVAAKQRARDARAGIMRGFDNQPMRRLGDGRTVVRSLGNAGTAESQGVERLAVDTGAADERAAGKNARSRAFVKKCLSERGGVMKTASLADHQAPHDEGNKMRKKAKKTVDDPLGLEDPELMQGGSLASRNGHKKMFGPILRGPKAASTSTFRGREGGGRISGMFALSRTEQRWTDIAWPISSRCCSTSRIWSFPPDVVVDELRDNRLFALYYDENPGLCVKQLCPCTYLSRCRVSHGISCFIRSLTGAKTTLCLVEISYGSTHETG